MHLQALSGPFVFRRGFENRAQGQQKTRLLLLNPVDRGGAGRRAVRAAQSPSQGLSQDF